MIIRPAIAAATAVALITAPAGAHDRRRHHDKNDGVGAFLAGAVIAGGLVALLAGKKKPAPPPADVAVEPSAEENDAANRCADAAERTLGEDGREARVERVASVTPRDGGGFKVKGDIRVADAGDGYGMRFSCTVRGEDVRSMVLTI